MAEIEVITVNEIEELDRLMLENKEMKNYVHKVMSQVLIKARSAVSKDVKNSGVLAKDPRAAYKAIKRAVYKRILGGNISILDKKKASSTRVKIEHQSSIGENHLGGNRRKRSERTDKVDSYYGSDRGFILRFINNGTGERNIKHGNYPTIKNPGSHGGHSSYDNRNTGRRGSISPRNFFSATSQRNMEKAAEYFCNTIDAEIERINKIYTNG